MDRVGGLTHSIRAKGGSVLRIGAVIAALAIIAAFGSDRAPRPDPLTVQNPGSDVPVPVEGASRIVDRIRESGIVPVAFSGLAPYVGFSPAVQDFRGISLDLQREVQAFLSENVVAGVATRGRQFPWDEVLERLITDQYLVVLNGPDPAGTPYEGRVTLIPLGERGSCLIGRAETSYATLAEAIDGGARIGAVSGTAAERGLRAETNRVESASSPIAESSLPRLLAGELDVIPVDSRAAPLIVEEFPELRWFPETCGDQPLWPERFGMLVVTDDPAWVQFVSALGARLQSDGWFDARLSQALGSSALRGVIRNLGAP